MSNIVYWIQYLTVPFTLDLQEDIYTQVPNTHYMSATEAGRHVVDLFDFCIAVFLEVQNKRSDKILHLINYIAYGCHLSYKYKYSIKCAENLFPNIMA